MSAHTPGPWRVDAGNDYSVIGANDAIVLLIGDRSRLIPTNHDAALIAAAPDMLAALKPLWVWADNERRKHLAANEENEAAFMAELADAARSAIAKAEGDNPSAR